MTLRSWLISIGACREGLDWHGTRGIRRAYRECPRGDWLAWLLSMLDRRLGVRAACAATRVLWKDMPKASRRVIVDMERWATTGEGDVGKIRDRALRAYYAASASAASAASVHGRVLTTV